MKTATRTAPFLRLLVTACALAVCAAASGQATNFSKKVLHTDGTTTESASDVEKGELRESTFDARGTLLSKRIVLLNEYGLPVQGMIYNGRDEMVGKVLFAYDELGRVKEELSLNAQGQVFRRKFQFYDQGGKPLPSKIVDYAANAPNISSNSINFTKMTPPPVQGEAVTPISAQQPKQPGEAPQIQKVSPRSKPEEKKSLFKKLFNK